MPGCPMNDEMPGQWYGADVLYAYPPRASDVAADVRLFDDTQQVISPGKQRPDEKPADKRPADAYEKRQSGRDLVAGEQLDIHVTQWGETKAGDPIDGVTG